MSISGSFPPYSLYQGPDNCFGGRCLRVLIMFQLTYSTTFKSKYFATYGVFKLSGQNMSQNATKKLNPLYRKRLTFLHTHTLIPPPFMTQPNVFCFVSNHYLRIWFYWLLSTYYLAFSLYRAGTDNVLYLRYTKFWIAMLSFSILLHAIYYYLVHSMVFKSFF
jgi:hypothetical protein